MHFIIHNFPRVFLKNQIRPKNSCEPYLNLHLIKDNPNWNASVELQSELNLFISHKPKFLSYARGSFDQNSFYRKNQLHVFFSEHFPLPFLVYLKHFLSVEFPTNNNSIFLWSSRRRELMENSMFFTKKKFKWLILKFTTMITSYL